MTWVLVLSLIIIALIKILFTSPPTFVVDWFVGKFELHQKLNEDIVNININGKSLQGEEKQQIIKEYNEAIFLKRYGDVIPKKSGIPLVIDTKRGKNDVRLFVYRYDDHIDIFREYKKNVVAYRLLSESLQTRKISIDLLTLNQH
ncbi:YfmQ family protein [Heyndrickxia ginsengihumi]|uniref:Uncharacterized protein n=1 Tax=Heyndrickxia ginsengihumi TaxID=363870 RepID=A0A0A6VHN0_9BACI|nr:YfmQ family protein [Heyndrickxia ginsengihumi]KHD86923.1 hypothetical protein NG54_00685 [Heyndrickxia ginsengihumi]MBE6182748.1 hypothetical protein [Bacillus sp. (in: firmicutes)]MCM3021939.1 YfmQ family protein [Heyndrickxia ginsengihumi]NEY20854.1 hypothetical protein [Heyndrickxia ginsengihumi]